jgi:hypothetical protein
MATQDPRWHDTEVLPGSPGWHDTAVLLPEYTVVAPGWYADPYDPTGMRYWDGAYWTAQSSPAPWGPSASTAPRPRRSVLLGFVLAVFFGGLALPYALPLPWWARLLIAVAVAIALGWWLLLVVPLTWPFALILVPLLTALGNRRS